MKIFHLIVEFLSIFVLFNLFHVDFGINDSNNCVCVCVCGFIELKLKKGSNVEEFYDPRKFSSFLCLNLSSLISFKRGKISREFSFWRHHNQLPLVLHAERNLIFQASTCDGVKLEQWGGFSFFNTTFFPKTMLQND